MSSWLSPLDIQIAFKIGKTMTFKLLKEYKDKGGEIIRIGRLTRVPEEQFTDFLKGRGNEECH